MEEKTIKNLVTHVPHKYYQCTRVPRAHGRKGRKTFWTYSTRLCLRHVGDVTVVLSKKGRNMSPQHTKIRLLSRNRKSSEQCTCFNRRHHEMQAE